MIHADPSDRTPLGDLAVPAVTAHPDETLRALANRMAQHDVTRLLVVTRGERPHVLPAAGVRAVPPRSLTIVFSVGAGMALVSALASAMRGGLRSAYDNPPQGRPPRPPPGGSTGSAQRVLTTE
ncbi:hypothetical protein [Streptomyces sp. NPDC093984]|uniref:hypothetical protein n=1 Tax=Streptomyces sp. NPDC093984 TaxID=3366052 RepID=UPI00382BBC49